MNVFSINWKETVSFYMRQKSAAAVEDNTQRIMDYYDTSPKLPSITIIVLEFQQALPDIAEARFVLEDKLIMLVFDAMHDG